MIMLKTGEKLLVCSVCGYPVIIPMKEPVSLVKCIRCGFNNWKVVRARSTNVSGVGRNEIADLGLALLMEMQEEK